MKLKTLIESYNGSLRKLSRECGISRPTLYNILGDKEVSYTTLKKVCKFFNVDFKNYLD